MYDDNMETTNFSGKCWISVFRPLVLSLAERYQGHDAALFDDLVQEGYLGVLELVPQCSDQKWLPLFMRRRLEQRIRRAVKKMRGNELDIDNFAETLADPEAERRFSEIEIRDLLERALSDIELDFVEALWGYTQAEIAGLFGVSQPAVAQRICGIRKKIRQAI